jgi:hypothetical protein
MDPDDQGLVSGQTNAHAGDRVANIPPCKPVIFQNRFIFFVVCESNLVVVVVDPFNLF